MKINCVVDVRPPFRILERACEFFSNCHLTNITRFFAAVDAFLPSVEMLKTLKPAEANATELSTYLYLVTKWGHVGFGLFYLLTSIQA